MLNPFRTLRLLACVALITFLGSVSTAEVQRGKSGSPGDIVRERPKGTLERTPGSRPRSEESSRAREYFETGRTDRTGGRREPEPVGGRVERREPWEAGRTGSETSRPTEPARLRERIRTWGIEILRE